MTAWDDIRFEWARGSYRLSTEDSLVVMARIAELERALETALKPRPEFSEPTVERREDGTFAIEWGVRGTSGSTKVADELIDQWVADRNRLVALEARRSVSDDDEICMTHSSYRKAGTRICMVLAFVDEPGICRFVRSGPPTATDPAPVGLEGHTDPKEAP